MSKILKKKNKKVIIVSILAIVILLGVGIFFLSQSSSKLDNPLNKEPESEKEPEPIKKVTVIDLDSNTRPIAVMINNNSAVWKYQSGLNDAYIVYEMLVEGGITREMAVFKDKDTSKIQSIRSSRHYFLDYALENDAIYVHWGWSPQAQSDIKSLGINNINGLTYEGKYFFRDSSVKAAYEHKGYTTMEHMKNAISALKYRSTTESDSLLTYSVDPIDLTNIEEVQDANYISIKFSSSHTSKFIYDSENKVYAKTQNNTEMYDYTSKERFTTKNIITYQVEYPRISGDTYGRLNMSNVGSGTGYYISEGKAVKITWEKTSRNAKTIYKMMDGSVLKVNDGNTYIEIQPKNQSLTISAEVI